MSSALHLPAAADTELLGAALARALPPPGSAAVLHLQGDLGAGKTTCVRSLLRALGVAGLVRSPTYTLVQSYATPAITCIHLDLYRLHGHGEADDLGLRDLAVAGTLLLVEWPEKGGRAVPRADLGLTLSYAEEGRLAHLTALTKIGNAWLGKLADDSSLTPYVFNIA